MIKEYKVYSAKCDLCNVYFAGEDPKVPVLYFPEQAEAVETISENGWIVMHNIPDHCPRILCPACNKEAEEVMGESSKCTTEPSQDPVQMGTYDGQTFPVGSRLTSKENGELIIAPEGTPENEIVEVVKKGGK